MKSGGHLGRMTWNICIKLHSPFLLSLHMKALKAVVEKMMFENNCHTYTCIVYIALEQGQITLLGTIFQKQNPGVTLVIFCKFLSLKCLQYGKISVQMCPQVCT